MKNNIEKNTWKYLSKIRSSGRIYNEQLLDLYDSVDNVSDIQLLLTVIASYYINGDDFPKWRTSEFVVKFINNLLWGKKEGKSYLNHVKYIEKHVSVYNTVKQKWKKFEKGNCSIKELVEYVWKNLYGMKSPFRKWIVSHNPWIKLSDSLRRKACIEHDDVLLHKNSSFVFPPHSYTWNLLKRLEKRLIEKELWVYDKAALIWSYIFLIHPFVDGNSRTSRILMISYLDSYGKSYIKLYTFLSAFVKDVESYEEFLMKKIYPLFDKIKDKVEVSYVNGKADVVKYVSIDEYEKIILQASKFLRDRIVSMWKYIYKESEYIQKILTIIKKHSELKWWEKAISNNFLKNLFDIINKNWLEKLKNYEDIFELSKSLKKDPSLTKETIEKVKQIYKEILKR